jgi:hypothetical protein
LFVATNGEAEPRLTSGGEAAPTVCCNASPVLV